MNKLITLIVLFIISCYVVAGAIHEVRYRAYHSQAVSEQ